jgi:DNA-binding LacI/PurR family transcriptional regulator
VAVGIRDVARAAGVSPMTVSRVVNGQAGVSDETRRRVLEAISELGYRPSRAARELSRGRGRSVTVLTSNTTLYGRAALLRGIEQAAGAAGYHVEIGVLESSHPPAVAAAVDRSCAPTVGGVIVIAFDLAGTRALGAVPAGVPLVAALEVDDVKNRRPHRSLALDDRTAAFDATRYLLALGHRTVHHVSIPSSTRTSARMRGWRDALRRSGVEPPRPVAGGWTPRSGSEAGRALAADPAVTAVLCGNDDLALGVLHALREAGRDVPRDVSVIGFDDTPAAPFYPPPLTTVRLDFVGLGRDCFALLRHAIDPGETPPAPTAATPELVIRQTTGPAPVTAPAPGRAAGPPRSATTTPTW